MSLTTLFVQLHI